VCVRHDAHTPNLAAYHCQAQYFARFFCSKSARSTELILAASTKSRFDNGAAHRDLVRALNCCACMLLQKHVGMRVPDAQHTCLRSTRARVLTGQNVTFATQSWCSPWPTGGTTANTCEPTHLMATGCDSDAAIASKRAFILSACSGPCSRQKNQVMQKHV
jgi:hypothetical protein